MTKKKDRKGLMLVLSSPSGAGKTSICRKLLEIENDLVMSISYTTRKKRKSEINGIDYFFVSDKEFEKLKNDDFFIEYAKVFDNWYGTPKKNCNGSHAKRSGCSFRYRLARCTKIV